MKALLLRNFPLPPSVNKLYANIQGVGRVSTKELRDYKETVRWWSTANKPILNAAKDLIREDWKDAKALRIDTYFVFKHERIFTKKGVPKSLDASNFIKAAHDQLAICLEIDDKAFWAGSFEKLSGENECVIIMISPHTPITSVELLEEFSESDGPKGLN